MLETRTPREPTVAPHSPANEPRSFDFSPWTTLPVLTPKNAETPEACGPGAFERWVALLMFAGITPLLAAIAVAIKVESPRGTIFYRQERVGIDRRRPRDHASAENPSLDRGDRRKSPGAGRTFRIWKFRTMVPNAEAGTGPIWATENDPRVTRVGRFLRTLRMDELPQLLNVVQGDMRLIGPRPERPQFVAQLAKAVPEYWRRHSVPPGITGLAQVQRSYDASLDDVVTKLKYDLFYVDNRCLMLNVKILMKTFDVVFRGRGAH